MLGLNKGNDKKISEITVNLSKSVIYLPRPSKMIFSV